MSMKIAALFVLAALIGSIFFAMWAVKHDYRRAVKTCESLNAEPVRTGSTYYLCVAPDGRVVGRS